MTANQPTIALNNGVELPALGFGVFQTPPDVTQAAVEEALRVGYRMVDTAASYLNERGVGAAIAASGVPRSELFVQTKVWVSDYGHDEALHAFDVSTRKLGLDTIDLYLLHQPLPQAFDATVAAYRALERLLAEGRVRAIGVSNFSPASPRDVPAPGGRSARGEPGRDPPLPQPAWSARPPRSARHRDAGLVAARWRLRLPSRDPDEQRDALADPVITAIATRHRKSPAQVLLRWHIDRGRSAIPKSVRPERIAENLDVFDFSLDPDELAAIDALDTGVRGGPDQDAIDFRTFDRTIPET